MIPSSTEIENFKSNLQEINGKFGFSLYMTASMKMVPTKVGPAPLGGYLSYELPPAEGNFEVRCNVDFSGGRSDNDDSTNNLPEPLKHGIEHESAALQQYTNHMKHIWRLHDRAKMARIRQKLERFQQLLQRNSGLLSVPQRVHRRLWT